MQRGGRPSARDRVLASRMVCICIGIIRSWKRWFMCKKQSQWEIKGLDY